MPTKEGTIKIARGSDDFVEAPYFKLSDIDRGYLRLYDGDNISAFALVNPDESDVPLRIIGPNGNIWGLKSTVISFTHSFESGIGTWTTEGLHGDAETSTDSKDGSYSMHLWTEDNESTSGLLTAYSRAYQDKNWGFEAEGGDTFSFWWKIGGVFDGTGYAKIINSSNEDSFVLRYSGSLDLIHQDSNQNTYDSSSTSVSVGNGWHKSIFEYNPGNHKLTLEDSSGNVLGSTSISSDKGGIKMDEIIFGLTSNYRYTGFYYVTNADFWVDQMVVK